MDSSRPSLVVSSRVPGEDPGPSPPCHEPSLSRFGRHFVRIRELKAFERRFVSLVVDHPRVFHTRDEALFRYALNLAQLNLFRTPDGQDISLKEEVNGLRRWMKIGRASC